MHTRLKRIFQVSLLITGATIGAGILGLPIQTGLAGAVPTIVVLISAWALFLWCGIILAHRFVREHSDVNDYPTAYREDFGRWGEWLAIIGYLVNYYGIMVAYICGGGSIIQYLLPFDIPGWASVLLFFVPSTIITLFGLRIVMDANALVMVGLFVCIGLLCVLVGTKIQPSYYRLMEWRFFPCTVPIIMSAFLFHNIIPELCRRMNNDLSTIRLSMIIGTLIALIINLVWIVVVLGVIPIESDSGASILKSFNNNDPATIPLSQLLNSPLITTTGMAFSLCAIFTSYVAVAVGLRSFFGDLIGHSRVQHARKSFILCLTFLPPLAVAVFYPQLFLKALDIAGGLGGVLIFGVFPALIAVKCASNRRKKAIGIVLLIVFLTCIGCEIAQEFGLLSLPRNREYWAIVFQQVVK